MTICGRTEERLRSAVTVLEEAAAASAAAGPAGRGRPAYVVADVTVEEQMAEAVAAAAGRGRLDILFANAGGACTWARSSAPTWPRSGPPSTST